MSQAELWGDDPSRQGASVNSGAPRSGELRVSQDQVCEAGAHEGGQLGLGWVGEGGKVGGKGLGFVL